MGKLRMEFSKIPVLIIICFLLTVADGSRVQKTLQNEVIELVNTMKGEMTSLQSQMNSQQATIITLKETISQNTKEIERLDRQNANPTLQYRQTDFGCFSESITLWCFDGGVINITEAYYGQYIVPCGSNECCMPNQTADCRVSVPENRPGDWAELKAVCTNRSSCQYEYQGSSIDECEENYLADYMQIYYSCGQGSVTPSDPIGFSAYAESSVVYDPSEPIAITGVISNIGNSYNALNSSFECPFTGVYLFSLALKGENYYNSEVRILLDGLIIATVTLDSHYHIPTGSTSVVLECGAGQVVWIQNGDEVLDEDAYIMGGSDRESIFTGYMIHSYK